MPRAGRSPHASEAAVQFVAAELRYGAAKKDLLLAAQAVTLGHTFVTNNLRELRRVPELRCERW